MSFLDVLVDRDSRAVQCSVYRKPTFTNLGTSFFSFIPTVYKINSIRTLVHRAYHLSSSFFTFQKEVDFLRNYFDINGYPSFCIDKCLKQFLNKVYHPTEPVITVPREQIFIKLPYFGQNSVDLVNFFVETLKFFYPQIDFKFVLGNECSIGGFFKLKEALPDELRSHIIYKYICDACQATYYGSTVKQSKVRFSQHFGKSHRTSLPISKPLQSSIRDHCLNNDHPMRIRNFNILACAEDYNLRTLESIYINKNKPELNIDQSAVPLAIL